MFFEHMQKYELDFADGKEFLHRLEIFAEEVARVEKHNADPKKTSTEGLNQFSHMTISEWRDAVRLSTRPPPAAQKPRSRAWRAHRHELRPQ